jgi:hypothetical protein
MDDYIPNGHHVIEDADGMRFVKTDPDDSQLVRGKLHADALAFLKEKAAKVPYGMLGLNKLPFGLYDAVAFAMVEFCATILMDQKDSK